MQAIKLQRKYPQVSQEEMFSLIDKFNAITTDTPGRVPKATVIQALQAQGESYDRVRETLKDVSIDASGKVEVEDWVELNVKLKTQQQSVLPTKAGKVTVKGSNANVSHTINEDERSEFTIHINGVLAGDQDIGSRLPIPTDTMQLFDECRDGLILSKLINDSVPDTIDTRVLNVPKSKPLNAFQITENNNIVILSAKAIGCSVVNIGPQDIADGKEILILGLIWQIIRKGLLSRVDIKFHPELYRLLYEDETLEDFLKLPPDQILLRWFNYHLKAAGSKRKVNNFSKDVNDGENYTVLLHQLKPDVCSLAPLQTTDLPTRAEEVLQNADAIGCRKYLTAQSLLVGNPKLNLAFVANLFNNYPGLEALTEPPPEPVEDFDAEGEREARVFTLWMNSIGVEPGVYNLFEDVKNGIPIIQAFDKLIPGSVIWRRVNKPSAMPTSPVRSMDEDEEGPLPPQGLSRFKAVENNNYAIELAKANKMHIVGIQGADLVDGKKTLVLGVVWQLMRLSITQTLASLNPNGRPPSDQDMLRWANETAKKGHPQTTPLRSFKDPAISSGIFFLNLVDSMRPGIVDQSLVINPANSFEEQRQNAKLAISIARKMNALIFLVPEDIVDVRPRLDEAAVIALYYSAATTGAFNDFVTAIRELLEQANPVNPLESVAMEILEDVLKRASAGDNGAEELFCLLMTCGRPKEVVIALEEALGNLANQNAAIDSTTAEEDADATKLSLVVRGYSLDKRSLTVSFVALPRMVPKRVKPEQTVSSTLAAIRTAADVTLPTDNQEAEAYLISTLQLLSNSMEWCAKHSPSAPDSCKVFALRISTPVSAFGRSSNSTLGKQLPEAVVLIRAAQRA
ncbi:hypothetical protein FRC05_007345 [Tulasnella sp. 425]|nr:hypothetical protein FRC05_007345 [Tulasnella sp. 425]